MKNIEQFIENLKSNKIAYWILVPFLMILGIGIFALTRGKFNFGGIFSFRKTPEMKIVNSIKNSRKSSDGKIIAIGVSDKRKFVQVKQVEIKPRINPFRDKTILVTEKNEIIKLPVGVIDTDVETVIKLKPDVNVIKLKNDAPHEEKYNRSIDDLLQELNKL